MPECGQSRAKRRAGKAGQARARRAPWPPRYHPGPPIADEEALAEAPPGLRALDPELIDRLVAIGGPPPLRRREPGFAGLAAIIVSQQVSVASANAIFGRLEAAFTPLGGERARGGRRGDAAALRPVDAEDQGAARARRGDRRGGLDLDGLAALDADEAHAALVAVKGVGPWTADIFLLFCLGHPDAFPAGDLALQEAAQARAEPEDAARRGELERIAERWRPLRGVAARMLWAFYRGQARARVMALADGSGYR